MDMEGVYKEGLVFKIQRFSIHDGPGIRTTVFLKGCNLRCLWCHNPESMDSKPQLQLFPQKCIGCGKCLEVCPVHAHRDGQDGRIFLRELCLGCGKCAETCYAEALVMTGKYMTIDETILDVEKDRPFYEESGGGITLSGGEPLLQKEFVKGLLTGCKSRGLHTVVDTAGNIPWDVFEEVMPYVDLFLYDFKAFDSDRHKKATGVKNSLILDNLRKLGKGNTDIWIRIPVIPGINDTPENMENIAGYIRGMQSVKLVELLPFHNLAAGKYQSLGMEYGLEGIEPPAIEDMQRFIELFDAAGLPVKKDRIDKAAVSI